MGSRDVAAQAARALRQPEIARITELERMPERTAAQEDELVRLKAARLAAKERS